MYPNLNAEMARNNITQIDISKKLNLSYSTVSDKINGKKDFKLKECKEIILNLLPGTTIDYLFATNVDSENNVNGS